MIMALPVQIPFSRCIDTEHLRVFFRHPARSCRRRRGKHNHNFVFVQAVNQVIKRKDEVLSTLQEALATLTDSDRLEHEIERLQAEQDAVAQQMSRMIRENAEVAQNQAEYNARLQPLEEG